MKMKNNWYILLLTIVILLSSCTDVLDMAPDGNMQMDEVLSDPDKVEAMVNTLYSNIPLKGYAYFFFDPAVVACSDDGWSSEDSQGQLVDLFYKDNTSASWHPMRDYHDGHAANTNGYWDRYWQQIRLCSQFLELIDGAAVNNEDDRGRFKAEARVMRAFFYMELIKWFGKLPVLDQTVPFDADFSTMTRQPVYEVAKQIVADCNAAIAEPTLPWRIDTEANGERATKALACALKTEAMLFAASPLHNEGQNYWEEAYQIAKESVAQLKSNGYELFTTCTQPNVFGTGPAAAFRQLVNQNMDFSGTPRDMETIYQARSGGLFVWHIGYIGSNMANTYKCGTCPTQELVDAFETIDGIPVLDLKRPYLDENHLVPNYNKANALYDPNDPYINRDPRFYETVLHNGSKILWDNKEVTVETFIGGAHAPSFDVTNRVSSRTGYYHSKMVTPGASGTNQINNANWKFYRLGGILLSLAEAAAESGHAADALLAVNEVRARSGMPDMPAGLSQEELILRIRNERRVELAWEENRYFDLRRWQTPDGNLSETGKWFTAMVITKNSDGSFTYTRRNISSSPRGGWQTKDLLLPLPLSEASLLESVTGQKWQNTGW
ncbi:MAG: RagB/SusD family nutrient uptake outer membrane protein [Bacteroidia bacterium]|nr:RagB/SusD family nutrient uptake outer membrane protein [Bacteroidia bacterium]